MLNTDVSNYQQRFREVVDYLEMLSDPLEVWIVQDHCPDWGKIFENPNSTGLGCIGLGPLTRNERLEIGENGITFTDPKEQLISVPYTAIYNIAIRGSHTDLDWPIADQQFGPQIGKITYHPFYYPAGAPDEWVGPAK